MIFSSSGFPIIWNAQTLVSEVLPNIYASQVDQRSVLSYLGSKLLLPVGTTRLEDDVGTFFKRIFSLYYWSSDMR